MRVKQIHEMTVVAIERQSRIKKNGWVSLLIAVIFMSLGILFGQNEKYTALAALFFLLGICLIFVGIRIVIKPEKPRTTG